MQRTIDCNSSSISRFRKRPVIIPFGPLNWTTVIRVTMKEQPPPVAMTARRYGLSEPSWSSAARLCISGREYASLASHFASRRVKRSPTCRFLAVEWSSTVIGSFEGQPLNIQTHPAKSHCQPVEVVKISDGLGSACAFLPNPSNIGD